MNDQIYRAIDEQFKDEPKPRYRLYFEFLPHVNCFRLRFDDQLKMWVHDRSIHPYAFHWEPEKGWQAIDLR